MESGNLSEVTGNRNDVPGNQTMETGNQSDVWGNQSMDPGEHFDLYSEWQLSVEIRVRRIIVGGVILAACFVIVALALYGTVKLNKQWTPERCLMLNFCLSHLAYGLVCAEQLLRYATRPYFGYVNCQLRAMAVYVTLGCTVLSLMMITFHRYFRVVFHNRPGLGFSTVKRAVVGVVASWAVHVLIVCLPLAKLWGEFGLEKNQACRIMGGKHIDSFLVNTYTILPIVLQAACYLHIYITVRRHNRKVAPSPVAPAPVAPTPVATIAATIRCSTAPTPRPATCETATPVLTPHHSPPGPAPNGSAPNAPTTTDPALIAPAPAPPHFPADAAPNAAARRRQREVRLALLAFGFVATFALCFIPYSVTNSLDMLTHPAHEFAVNFVWAFLAINPLLYVLGEQRVRQFLAQKLRACCK